MKYYKPNNSTLLYLNSSYNCVKSSSITLTTTTAGTGYTGNPTIVVTPAQGDMGIGCSGTVTQTSGALGTTTTVNGGSGYNTLPIVSLVGGGSPGVITGYTALVAGTGYTSQPTITASGGGGSGFSAKGIVGSIGISSTFNLLLAGTGYAVNDALVFTGGGGSGAAAKVSTVSANCITSLSITSGGTNYTSVSSLTASGGGGSGFSGYTIIDNGSIVGYSITSVGSGYTSTPTIVISNGGGSGAVITPTIKSGVISGISLTTAGTGYTSIPTITITSTAGVGASLTCSLVQSGTGITDITIISGGSGYTSAPTFVFSGGGGSGASATPTVNVGTAAVITPSFNRTYSYTWNIPDVVVNDLAKLSAINIIATGFTATTPYTYRILGLQYDSRDSFFSDFGNPILSMAQNTNVCAYGSLGGSDFCIILTPQTIKQISISVDDSIITKNSGQLASIAFVIALEIVEYNPEYEEISDAYAEGASRLKLNF